jgi:hypothetical protein
MTGEERRLNMNKIFKYVAAAAMTGALALAATTTPSQARWGHGWHGGGGAAAGFAAGAFIGAAAASSAYYGDGYYYGGDYAYDPGPGYAYAPGYAYTDSYAYAPGPSYGYRSRATQSCGQSPASMNYTSCD